ncbi:MAG: MaoC family dehydratase [Candidatus Abyssobacteria bacterium SURF_17]|jgi:acyl dehydratase|uniref:MaoC family dehydratase n=1 Tax=Candidatus Abyssobacteria bacterium SURF_17 TaxID=2093361 RepID=A0A419EY42_9BACT|nr:MAG: MaoC family dehydratase [Candidatus Abyssubacteria bacterium SURF_17]
MVDKSVIGKTTPTCKMDVEKGHIRRFAQAIGDDNPLYYDEEYAKKSRYGGIIAPPTFPTVFGFEGERVLSGLDINYARLLHGEQEYEYLKPIMAGDTIRFSTKITDVDVKEGKGGAMDIIKTEMAGYNQHDEKVFVARSTVVIRR